MLAMATPRIIINVLLSGASSLRVLSLVACVNHRQNAGELKPKSVLGYASSRL